jgi:hypothetical protein
VAAYAVLSNHYHIVLRIDRDRALSWSIEEILARWTQLFTGPLLVTRYLSEERGAMSAAEVAQVEMLADVYRARLHDLSWFMRTLNEHIARQANAEDGVTGRFWEGRFKSQALLDEAALVAAMAYVDLNPVRAGLAATPEASDYTSIQTRVGAVPPAPVAASAATPDAPSSELPPATLDEERLRPEAALPPLPRAALMPFDESIANL